MLKWQFWLLKRETWSGLMMMGSNIDGGYGKENRGSAVDHKVKKCV